MKRFIFICVVSILWFSSCTTKTIKIKEITEKKEFFLTNDTTKGSLKIDFDVEFPIKYKDTITLKKIRNIIITNLFREYYTSIQVDSIIPCYVKELKTDYERTNLPIVNLKGNDHYSFNNEQVLSGFSLLSDKHIYVYGIERYAYMGGTQGLETRNYFNFNLENGNLITEKDIFLNGYEKDLTTLLQNGIKSCLENNKDSIAQNNTYKLNDIDAILEYIKPNGNFYITDVGINYVFNPYDFAMNLSTELEVQFSYQDLKNILKPSSIISYLINNRHK